MWTPLLSTCIYLESPEEPQRREGASVQVDQEDAKIKNRRKKEERKDTKHLSNCRKHNGSFYLKVCGRVGDNVRRSGPNLVVTDFSGESRGTTSNVLFSLQHVVSKLLRVEFKFDMDHSPKKRRGFSISELCLRAVDSRKLKHSQNVVTLLHLSLGSKKNPGASASSGDILNKAIARIDAGRSLLP